jgi:hypothetical protein
MESDQKWRSRLLPLPSGERVGVRGELGVTIEFRSPSLDLLTPLASRPLPAGERRENESRSAIEAAVAEIHSAFSRAAEIDAFKLRVKRWLWLGPQHPAARARFRARAVALPQWRLDAAIREVERWWREERKAFALASALGYGSRLPLETLREVRLILRLLRRKGIAAESEAIAEAVCDDADVLTLAAE